MKLTTITLFYSTDGIMCIEETYSPWSWNIFDLFDFRLLPKYIVFRDFKTSRTAKHMAYFMIRVFNTVYHV